MVVHSDHVHARNFSPLDSVSEVYIRPFKIDSMVYVKHARRICLDFGKKYMIGKNKGLCRFLWVVYFFFTGFTKNSDVNHTIYFEWPYKYIYLVQRDVFSVPVHFNYFY